MANRRKENAVWRRLKGFHIEARLPGAVLVFSASVPLTRRASLSLVEAILTHGNGMLSLNVATDRIPNCDPPARGPNGSVQ